MVNCAVPGCNASQKENPQNLYFSHMMFSRRMEGCKNSPLDPAQYFEQQLLKYQEPMNAVIDRGDSPVQQFYRGATVFLTGGSGFLGKQLIEKLFRSCEIKKMYILLRSRKSKSSQQRKDYILKDSVFDLIREKQPNFADRIVPVDGEVTEIRLGFSDKQWNMLTEEVDTIFHGAATVRFDSPLALATITNVRGTRETITLAKSCKNLKSFVYISTAYTHATKDRIGQEVLEQFYECPVSPELMIEMAENIDSKKLDKMTQGMIKGWPNTYTFTKAIAEELIRQSSDMPMSVIKPPIVIGAYYEPGPGWLDLNAIQGPSGIILGVGIGILRVFYVNKHCSLPMTPVDYVNNCTIAAAWDAAERRKRGEKEVPLYTVTNKDAYFTWSSVGANFRTDWAWKMSSPKAVWYCFLIETKNKFLYNILAFYLHYIPAYIMDAACYVTGIKLKKVPSFVGIYRKVEKYAEIFDYFLSNEWDFKDTNVKTMLSNMSDADRAIYNCDVNTIDLDEMSAIWGGGIRKYIIKDKLENSFKAYAKQKKLRILHYTVLAIFLYSFWKLVCYFWSCLDYYVIALFF